MPVQIRSMFGAFGLRRVGRLAGWRLLRQLSPAFQAFPLGQCRTQLCWMRRARSRIPWAFADQIHAIAVLETRRRLVVKDEVGIRIAHVGVPLWVTWILR